MQRAVVDLRQGGQLARDMREKLLMESLPAGTVRDIALSEILDAHVRTEHALARKRILN